MWGGFGKRKDFELINGLEERWGHMVNGKFILVENKVTDGATKGIYRFVEQPSNCTHASCGFTGDKVGSRLVKPKCTYQSWRKATTQELSDPALKDVYIAVWVTWIDEEADRSMGLFLFDCSADEFVKGELQDGGNERLVFGAYGKSPGFVTTSNYDDLVEQVKKAL